MIELIGFSLLLLAVVGVWALGLPEVQAKLHKSRVADAEKRGY